MIFNEGQFSLLWESNADEYEFYDLAHEMRPGLTFDEFDKAWQFLTILSPEYETAREHFLMAVNQTF